MHQSRQLSWNHLNIQIWEWNFACGSNDILYVYIMMTPSNRNIFHVTGLCAGNSPVTDEFPIQRPVAWSFDVFFDLCLNKRLSKQSWGWWFEMPSCSLWRHWNVIYYGVDASMATKVIAVISCEWVSFLNQPEISLIATKYVFEKLTWYTALHDSFVVMCSPLWHQWIISLLHTSFESCISMVSAGRR